LGKSRTGEALPDVLRKVAQIGEWRSSGRGADAEKSALVRDRAPSI
jgi:hypothetical protein